MSTQVHSAADMQDIGLYLQGLLQIMAADNNLHDKQKERVKAYAEKIGFEKEYIESSIESALKNKYLSKTPPQFSSKVTAEAFLREATEIAICDGLLHSREKKWLIQAADQNNIDKGLIMPLLESVPLSDDKPA